MAKSKLVSRANYNCRRANYQRRKAKSRINDIEGRIRNTVTTIKPKT